MSNHSPWISPEAAAASPPRDELLERVVASRASSVAMGSLVLGVGSLVVSLLPLTGVVLVASMYGMATLLPLVGGMLAIASAWQSIRTALGWERSVQVVLPASKRAGPFAMAAVGATLGGLAVILSATNLWMVEILPPTPMHG